MILVGITSLTLRWRRFFTRSATVVLALVAVAMSLIPKLHRPPPAPVPLPPAMPPAPIATAQDETAIDALIAREKRRPFSALWLEMTIALAFLLLAVVALVIAREGDVALVLVRDVAKGDQINADDLVTLRLPQIEHTFSSRKEVNDVRARADLQAGSVLKTTDVVHPQVVATANIGSGELLDPAKNVAIRLQPFAHGALRPPVKKPRKAKQFIPAGSPILTAATEEVKASRIADVEIPLRAYVGVLVARSGDQMLLLATPRAAGGAALFTVCIGSITTKEETARVVVIMPEPEATRFAALPASDFVLMKKR
jgi:hypothetical protein